MIPNRPSPPRAASGPAPASTATTTPAYEPFAGQPAAVVDDALARVLASSTFRRSRRHRAFLEHVVRAALSGRHEDLKEAAIGLDVFGRDVADYDPRSDPIVRVEAGRIREKLDRYYAGEGAGDAFAIGIPIGGYLPRLSRRGATKPSVRSLGSFAVAPFANLSANADDALFCEALADQLIDRLSRVPGVRVVGRLSAIEARAKSADVKVRGKLLGVTHVVEGSVQRAGTRIRCIAQLSRTRDRVCVWSQRLQRDVGDAADLFAFQDEIADAVTAAVVDVGAPDARAAPPSPRATAAGNPEARDLYERARYLVQLRTNEALEKGIALLLRSIALDPDFAPAHAQLGIARSALYGVMARPALAAFREVEWSARRALELDPADGDARALIANIAFRIDRDWPRAEALFREALRANPSSATAHHWYGQALVFNGRYLEGLEHARIALDLDPLNITARINLAIITAYARDFATAVAELESVVDIAPGHLFAHFMLGSVYLWAGDGDAAMAHFDIASRIAPEHPIPMFDKIFVDGLRGNVAEGRAKLAALLARLDGTDYQLYNRAMAEAYLGDVAALCVSLRRAAAAHELLFVSLPADPSFDPYRDHPAFVALMDEFGLPRVPPSPFASDLRARAR